MNPERNHWHVTIDQHSISTNIFDTTTIMNMLCEIYLDSVYNDESILFVRLKNIIEAIIFMGNSNYLDWQEFYLQESSIKEKTNYIMEIMGHIKQSIDLLKDIDKKKYLLERLKIKTAIIIASMTFFEEITDSIYL